MGIFINLSNHPSSKWSEKQFKAALDFGEVIDLPFPQLDPNMSEDDIADLVNTYSLKVEHLADEHGIVAPTEIRILVQGEFTFTHHFVNVAKDNYIECVVATSERNTIDNEDGTKTVKFEFVRYRSYI